MSLRFIVREGMQGIQRARMSSLLSILAIIVASLLLNAFGLVLYNLQIASEGWQRNIEYEVYLIDNLNSEAKKTIPGMVKAFDSLATIDFIDKKKAALEFRQMFEDDAIALLGYNPLPESFRIRLGAKNLEFQDFEKHVREIESIRGVLSVDYARKQFSLLKKYIRYFYYISGILGGLVAIAAVFLIYNTVKLSIYARRGIIYTMRLVGATEATIRWPFFVQGAIEGMIGGIFSVGLLWLLIQAVQIYTDLPLVFRTEWLGIVVLISLGLGVFGSRLAIRRYLPSGLGL